MKAIEKKILNEEELKEACERTRQDKRIVLTTGAFDLVHNGHIDYLIRAKAEGDILVVGINNDRFVKELKGEGRPIKPEDVRAYVIGAMFCVDFVHIFYDRLRIVKLVKPHVFVMSSTSHAKPDSLARAPQQALVKKHGGEIKIFGTFSKHSSTRFVKKIKSS